MKIAVIGAGISGLTAAYILNRKHDVTVFEANDYTGGHTNTIDVQVGGENHAIDTGFIVFNHRNYPNFTRLLDQLNVDSQSTSMSFSVRCDKAGIEYSGTSLKTLFAQRVNLMRIRFWKMIGDIIKFNRNAPRLLQGGDAETSVHEYVQKAGFGSAFIDNYLVPLGASLWSCPTETFKQFPMRFVVEFLNNHSMLKIGGRPVWRVIKGGSKQYIGPLTRTFADRIHVNSPVRSIARSRDRVVINFANGNLQTFDHVVIACHSNTALKMLSDPDSCESELLGAFPYQPNEAILHTDTSVLPSHKRAWASWNYRASHRSKRVATVTYNMNMLQGINSKLTFCVTLNDDSGIDPAKIIRRIQYHHPVFTVNRRAAQSRHHELINCNRTSFCGAYWGYGFHEDGVNSALEVCKSFGMELQS